MKQKYFFFDVDGTLAVWDDDTKTSYMPESAKFAISKLKEQGYFVSLATGRSIDWANTYKEMIGIDNMVFDGGYSLMIDNKIVYQEPLDQEQCIGMIEFCKEKAIPCVFLTIHDANRWSIDEKAIQYFKAKENRDAKLCKENDLALFEDINKILIYCDNHEKLKVYKDFENLPWISYVPGFYVIEPQDKSKGIEKVLERFNEREGEVYVFGDNRNDISMFKDKWIKVAMGNAIDDLKELADYVTTPNNHDGIYNALVYFGLIEDSFY